MNVKEYVLVPRGVYDSYVEKADRLELMQKEKDTPEYVIGDDKADGLNSQHHPDINSEPSVASVASLTNMDNKNITSNPHKPTHSYSDAHLNLVPDKKKDLKDRKRKEKKYKNKETKHQNKLKKAKSNKPDKLANWLPY